MTATTRGDEDSALVDRGTPGRTRTGRNRRGLDGTVYPPDHDRAPTWLELVRKPAPAGPRVRTGDFYTFHSYLPTPEELRTVASVPAEYRGAPRVVRRQRERRRRRVLRKLGLT